MRKVFSPVAGTAFLLLGIVSARVAFADVSVTVDWGMVKRTIHPNAYGVNGSYAYTASHTGNPAYRKGLKYAIGKSGGGSGLLRLHRQGIVGDWSPGGVWNNTTIFSGLKPMIDDGFDVMIDFDRAIGGSGMEIQPQNAADLVRLVNVTGKLGVKYWEVFNENGGAGAERGAQVKACIKAMKAVDPSVLVGGPALSHFDAAFFDAFIQAAAPELDFLTFHGYGGGSTAGMTDSALYDWAWNTGKNIRQMREIATRRSPGKYLPIMMDEYNISWDWNTVDPRTGSNKGGVFSTLVKIAAIENGGDVTNRWNESEPAFGFMNDQGQPQTVAHVYHLLNQYGYGQQVAATSSDVKSVVAFAVKNGGSRTLVLINRSAKRQTANLAFAGWNPSGALERYQVWTRNGIDSSAEAMTAGVATLDLPDNSVTILTASTTAPVRPPDIRSFPSPSWNGTVTVTLLSAAGRRLSAFSATGNLSVTGLALMSQRGLGSYTGLYFITLESGEKKTLLGPYLANTALGK